MDEAGRVLSQRFRLNLILASTVVVILCCHVLFRRGLESILFSDSGSKNSSDNSSDDEDSRSFGILNSYKNLTIWSKNDRAIYKFLKENLKECDIPVDSSEMVLQESLQGYLRDFEESTLSHFACKKIGMNYEGEELDKEVASNFILAYRMARRFAKYGTKVQAFLQSKAESDMGQLIEFVDKTWPGLLEYRLVQITLMRVYEKYDMKFSVQQFLDYVNLGSVGPTYFTADMARDLALTAMDEGCYVTALDFINYGINLVKDHKAGNESLTIEVLVNLKHFLVDRHNSDKRIVESEDKEYLNFFTGSLDHVDVNTPQEGKWQRKKDLEYNDYLKDNPKQSDEGNLIKMDALCAGENLLPEKLQAKLRCYLDTERNPYYRINPLRVEVLSEDPEILHLYDIFGNRYAEELVRLIDAQDYEEKYLSGVAGGSLQLATRSSLTSWFYEDELPKLTFIAGAVTGLQASQDEFEDWSEVFQALEYVTGRFYVTHVDYFSEEYGSKRDDWSGNRVATLLFYLNDVELGGETVFTSALVSAKPKKGSAVFWKNHFRNGTPREDVWHAACPVLYGRKLVINKWFRSHIQLHKFPCSTNQFE